MDDLTAALYVLFERLEQATDETDLEVRQNIPLSPRRFFSSLLRVSSDETLTYMTKNTKIKIFTGIYVHACAKFWGQRQPG